MCDTSSSVRNENFSALLNEMNHANPGFFAGNSAQNDARLKNNLASPFKKCACRESVQWTWDKKNKSDFVEIINDNMDVRFHRNYSNGTAVVRCTEPMTHNQYYWEVKMTYPVYGTDIMIGVGTPEANLNHLPDRFVSLLGMDNKTWGFSYTGLFHHNGQRRCYAQSFGQGSIIGVHLDLWKGTISFYKDRKHLGVASYGLKGKTLYAMASSTAARSGMRIVRSCSFPSSLQFLCCAKLRELIPEEKNVLDVVEVPPGLRNFLRDKLGWLLEKRQLEQNSHSCCSFDESQAEKEDIADESSVGSVISDSRERGDPGPFTGHFILLGAVLSNHNRYEQAIRTLCAEGREDSQGGEAKRRRRTFENDEKCEAWRRENADQDKDSD